MLVPRTAILASLLVRLSGLEIELQAAEGTNKPDLKPAGLALPEQQEIGDAGRLVRPDHRRVIGHRNFRR